MERRTFGADSSPTTTSHECKEASEDGIFGMDRQGAASPVRMGNCSRAQYFDPRAEKFDPDRFGPERIGGVTPDA